MPNIREHIYALAETLNARTDPGETLEYIDKIESRLRILKRETNQKIADCAMNSFMQSFIGLLKFCDCYIYQEQTNDSLKIEIPGLFYLVINASLDTARAAYQEPVELVVVMNNYRLTFHKQLSGRCQLINAEEESGEIV